jgi:hypothetical protein
MTHPNQVFGAGKRDAERTSSDAAKLPASDQLAYPGGRGFPEDQKEDSRRRQESGQSGGERRPEPVEKGDARRDRGGPGQQGETNRPDAPEDRRQKRGSEKQ